MKKLATLFFAATSTFIFAQIPNPSFENWSGNNPIGWGTNNSLVAGDVTPSSIAYLGDSAARLNSVLYMSNYVGGLVETHCLVTGASSPAALDGWYILHSVGGDELEVIADTKCSSNINHGIGGFSDTASTLVYKLFSACILYDSSCVADSAAIILELTSSAGGGSLHAGSYAIVDDLSWGTCDLAGVNATKNNVDLQPSYPNPASDICNIIYSIPASAAVSISLYDLSGRKVMGILNNSEQSSGTYKIPVDVSKLANGVYAYTILVDGVPYTQKLVVAK